MGFNPEPVSQDDRLKAELAKLFNSLTFKFPAAVTLTMKKRVGGHYNDMVSASDNFRHFRNRMNSKLLGNKAKRYGAQLLMVAVIESSTDGRLHYHCIIDRPYYCSFERFEATVREQWARTPFGYRQIDIQDHADAGWTDYILKTNRQKESLLDSIDWNNCHLIAE